jgi:hypothetical protein
MVLTLVCLFQPGILPISPLQLPQSFFSLLRSSFVVSALQHWLNYWRRFFALEPSPNALALLQRFGAGLPHSSRDA